MEAKAKVAIVMGSESDRDVMQAATDMLDELGCDVEVFVMSAHRNPKAVADFAKTAHDNGFAVVIAGAGKAAHLPGVISSYTTLPVIGVPIRTSDLGGIDSLLSIVQMPKGVPVATVAINGAENAAILAAQIIALSNQEIAGNVQRFKQKMAGEGSQ